MPKNFHWQTEDDRNWDQLPDEAPAEQPNRWPRRLLMMLVILGLIAGLTAFLVRLVDRRVDENTSSMRSDIISSHNLLQFAEAEQDAELFFSLLSGRDSAWTASQHELFLAGLLYDRTPFGLQALPADPLPAEDDEAYSITFSPDLLTADVTTKRAYAIKVGNGLSQTVTLQEPVQYRLGRERWLLSPPNHEFWGGEETEEGQRITLTYPLRDAQVAQRLLTDLESKLDEICHNLSDIDCPEDLHFEIEFSSDPETLLDARSPQPATKITSGLRKVLPAPSLVGIPQDEAGYQALYRGYAAQIATATIAQQIGYECCQQLPLVQALIDNQLSELALKPWTVDDRAYGRILADQIHLQDYSAYWGSDDPGELYGPDGWRIYALIDYLLSVLPESSPALLQRELVRRGSFMGWLNGLFASENMHYSNSALLSMLTRGFWMRGYVQALSVADNWSGEPPPQDLYLTCVVTNEVLEDSQIATLYRYDTVGSAWHAVYDTSSFLWNTPLPADNYLLQQEFGIDDRRWTATIRDQDQVIPLLSGTDEYTVSFGQTDPATSGLAAFVFPPDSDEATITWFDLLNCQEGAGCENRELPGIPIWSPDGSRAVFTSNPNRQIDLLQTDSRTILFDRDAENNILPLYIGSRSELLEEEPLADVQSLTFIGRGHAPFWLDNNTVGYVAPAGDPVTRRGSGVMVRAVDQDETRDEAHPEAQNEAQELFTLSDLLVAIEDVMDAERLFWIHYVMSHPDDADQLYVVVLSALNQQAHVLSFDRGTNEVQYLMKAGWLSNHSLGISPDARYLVLTGMDVGDPNSGDESALVQVYDLEQQETLPFLSLTADFPPFSTYDWSLDSEWLALLLDDNMIGVLAPDRRQLHFIETPPGDCGSPAWINNNDG